MNHPACVSELDGFLSGIAALPTGVAGVTALRGDYDLTRFAPGLYRRAGVECPPAVARAVTRRQAEYLAGRCLSRRLWAERGQRPLQLGSGEHRQPLWPQAWVGSISHTSDIALSCLARSSEISLLGVDVEHWMTPEVARQISATVVDSREARYLETLGPFEHLLTLVFSAKESLFKALYPQVGRYFGFEAARVVAIQWAAGLLILRVTQDLSPSVRAGMLFECFFQPGAGVVFTIVARAVT
ncbi:hypothetical protein PS664_03692 [Pseudomonas fluorescens]|nr:hypothetical protein PS664_03692 [Pseudomonas fluorescens]